jgi:Ca-activated chloride channel family protein
MMRALTVVLATGLLAGFVYQQENIQPGPGIVAGRVASGSGAGLAGVRLELLRDGSPVYSTTSDSRGNFRFTSVAPGSYVIRATLRGFAVVVHPAVTAGKTPAPLVRLTMQRLEAEVRDRVAIPSVAAEAAAPSGLPIAGGILARKDVFAGFNTEAYDHIQDNRFRRASDHPLSTFSIDVDTASYANVRRFLGEGRLPPADAVRSEELINYFRFNYPEPAGDQPFSVTTELAACPWNSRHRLALIGLQARRLDAERTPPRNLVFLLDVSGSMTPPNKLPLVKSAMKMLADTLRAEDRVAVVVYAGQSGLALPSTRGNRKSVIRQSIADLRAGGSTNGASGIRLAYDIAAENFITGGVNRVILATDGDFNVGVTSQGELVRLIEEQRERGVFLSVIGVGTGNLKDSTMEKLADKGNGNYSYFDTLQEARRVLIAESGATLVTVAKDVKIQVEFNPAAVAAYRLIGYENRLLNREDFNDDRKDAGEIGAGHTVTALYEVIPPGEPIDLPDVDPLKYQESPRAGVERNSDEIMTVKLRHKAPDGDRSRLTSVVVKNRLAPMSANLGFAAAVAEFGMLLRRSEFLGQATWDSSRALAKRYRGEDPDGYRAEFIRLLDLAASLDRRSGDGEERR